MKIKDYLKTLMSIILIKIMIDYEYSLIVSFYGEKFEERTEVDISTSKKFRINHAKVIVIFTD